MNDLITLGNFWKTEEIVCETIPQPEGTNDLICHRPKYMFPNILVVKGLEVVTFGMAPSRFCKGLTYLPLRSEEGLVYWQLFVKKMLGEDEESLLKSLHEEVKRTLLFSKPWSEKMLQEITDIEGKRIFELTFKLRELNRNQTS